MTFARWLKVSSTFARSMPSAADLRHHRRVHRLLREHRNRQDRGTAACHQVSHAAHCRPRVDQNVASAFSGEAGAAGHRHRLDGQHELPAVQPGRGVAERFEILVVEDVDAERGDHQRVNRQRRRLRPSTASTSAAASLPRNATPRALIHGATDAWKPAALWPTFHGPSLSRRAQRPVRSSSASPGRDLDAGLLLPRFEVFDDRSRCPARDTAGPSAAGCR